MTVQEAQNGIGRHFRLSQYSSGILGRFDIIRRVKPGGTICGDFISAHAQDCQFKQEQPSNLKKNVQALSSADIEEMNQQEHENYTTHKLI